MDKSLKSLTKQVADKLSPISPTPMLEAELILGEVMGISRSQLLAESKVIIGPSEAKRVEQVVQLRLKRKPLQQILRGQDFMGNRFEVNDQVLIPRSDTEMLVKYAVDHIRKRLYPTRTLRVLDIGTGSGAIAVSIMSQLADQTDSFVTSGSSTKLPDIELWATDISTAALQLAEINAKKLLPGYLVERINFIESDVWSGLTGRTFDVIVSNPPYLPQGLKKDWQPELNFEPELALISGEDGFRMYRKILNGLKYRALPGAVFLGEFHSPLANEMLKLVAECGFKNEALLADLSGVNRYIQIEL